MRAECEPMVEAVAELPWEAAPGDLLPRVMAAVAEAPAPVVVDPHRGTVGSPGMDVGRALVLGMAVVTPAAALAVGTLALGGLPVPRAKLALEVLDLMMVAGRVLFLLGSSFTTVLAGVERALLAHPGLGMALAATAVLTGLGLARLAAGPRSATGGRSW